MRERDRVEHAPVLSRSSTSARLGCFECPRGRWEASLIHDSSATRALLERAQDDFYPDDLRG